MESISCVICDSTSSVPVLSAKDYISEEIISLVKCSQCNLVYVNPQPTLTEIGAYYPEAYYGDEPFAYEKHDATSRYNKIISSGIVKGNILDIGCGKGLCLGKLKKAGWNVWGTELSETSARFGREKLQLTIYNCNIEDANFEDGFFDIVTMFHSLEHMKNPIVTLRMVHKILKPGGLLLVEVPRINSMFFKIFKKYWFHLDVPRHLYHFDNNSLENLFYRSGFQPSKKQNYSLMYDSFGALQSILNCLCNKYNLLNDINTNRITLSTIFKSGKPRLILDAVISICLQSLLFIPLLIFCYFLSIFNNGGTLIYYGIKNEEYIDSPQLTS